MKKIGVLLLLSINCYSQGLQEIISKHRLAVGDANNVNSQHAEYIMVTKSITAPGQADKIKEIDDKFDDFVNSIDTKSPNKKMSNEFRVEDKGDKKGDCFLKFTPIDEATIKGVTKENSNVAEAQYRLNYYSLHKIGSRSEITQSSETTIFVNHIDEGSWISYNGGEKIKNEIHPDQLKEATIGLDLHKDHFSDVSALSLLPQENIDNTQLYVISNNKNKTKYYIDTKTFYIVRAVRIEPVKYGNHVCMIESITKFSDFRKIDGYVDAYKMEIFSKEGDDLISLKYSGVTFSIFERNKKFSPEIFKMPK